MKQYPLLRSIVLIIVISLNSCVVPESEDTTKDDKDASDDAANPSLTTPIDNSTVISTDEAQPLDNSTVISTDETQPIDLDSYIAKVDLIGNDGNGAIVGRIMIDRSIDLNVAGVVIPEKALPSSALPSSALPSSMFTKLFRTETNSDQGVEVAAAGVEVILYDDNHYERARTITDKKGVYAFKAIEPGTYQLEARALDGDGNTFALKKEDILIVADNIINLTTLTLAETGAIRGIVTLEGEEDHHGIDVYVPGTSFTGKTDRSGRYILVFIPEGTYDLVIEKNGYTTVSKEKIKVASKATSVVDPVILLLRTGRITGNVVLYPQLKKENLVLTLSGTSDSGGEVSRTTKTAKDGSFIFEKLPPGTYVVSAGIDDYSAGKKDNLVLKADSTLLAENIVLYPVHALQQRIEAGSAATIGQTIAMKIIVENIGGRDISEVMVECSAEDDLASDFADVVPEFAKLIKNDEEKTFTLSIDTTKASPGTLVIACTAQGEAADDGSPVSTFEPVSFSITLQTPGKLVVTSFTIPETLIAGSTNIPVSLVLKNDGSSPLKLRKIEFLDSAGNPAFYSADDEPFFTLTDTITGQAEILVAITIKTHSNQVEATIHPRIEAVDGNDETMMASIDSTTKTAQLMVVTWFLKLELGDIGITNSAMPDNLQTATISWADYDRDGKVDLLVGGKWSMLLKNKGDRTFTDTTANLANYFGCTESQTFYTFFDYDNDGDQDVIVSHCTFEMTTNIDLIGRYSAFYLLRNEGDGTFSDASDCTDLTMNPFCTVYIRKDRAMSPTSTATTSSTFTIRLEFRSNHTSMHRVMKYPTLSWVV